MEPILTVIIPAYNAEGLVADAVHSAIDAARGGSMRVVVVNDGSEDNTLAEIRATKADYDDDDVVSIIDRPINEGVSVARNAGLEAVTTPFVGFLDADDRFARDFKDGVLPQLADLTTTEIDVVEFNSRCIDESGREVAPIRCTEATNSDTVQLDPAALTATAHRFNNYLWCRIFRTSLFDGIRFPDGRDYEDVAVVPTLYTRARRVRQVGVDAVIRRYRKGSIMRTPTLAKAADWLTCHHAALDAARATADDPERSRYWSIVAAKCYEGLTATVVALPAGQWRAGRRLATCESHQFHEQLNQLAAADDMCRTVLLPTNELARRQARRRALEVARRATGRSVWRSRARRLGLITADATRLGPS